VSTRPVQGTTPATTVGVVGVGAMGLPMALRLHSHGIPVRAVDPSEARVARCEEAGIPASPALDLLDGSDVVIAMVATGPQLLELLQAPIVASGRLSGAVLVVASTVGPEVVRQAAEVAAEFGIRVMDSPVTGGVAGATAGALTFFGAGDEAVLAAVAPVLSPLGSVRVVGRRPGDGQAFKLVNQMLASIHLVAAAEAVAFAECLDLDLAVIQELLPRGAAGSWMLADRGRRMVLPASERPTETQLSVFVKDSGLVADAATSAGAHAPLTQAARAAWLRAAELGLEHGDDSGIVEVFRKADSSSVPRGSLVKPFGTCAP
jgi:3-hydroxyisobutyrate dehydrogenase